MNNKNEVMHNDKNKPNNKGETIKGSCENYLRYKKSTLST